MRLAEMSLKEPEELEETLHSKEDDGTYLKIKYEKSESSSGGCLKNLAL